MIANTSSSRKKSVDRQITSLAGEFFVAAELFKRGLQTSVTFGSAKAIDLFATNPEQPEEFGKWFLDYKTFPGIQPKDLIQYQERLEIFSEP